MSYKLSHFFLTGRLASVLIALKNNEQGSCRILTPFAPPRTAETASKVVPQFLNTRALALTISSPEMLCGLPG